MAVKNDSKVTLTKTQSVTLSIEDILDMLGPDDMSELVTDAQLISWFKKHKEYHDDFFSYPDDKSIRSTTEVK